MQSIDIGTRDKFQIRTFRKENRQHEARVQIGRNTLHIERNNIRKNGQQSWKMWIQALISRLNLSMWFLHLEVFKKYWRDFERNKRLVLHLKIWKVWKHGCSSLPWFVTAQPLKFAILRLGFLRKTSTKHFSEIPIHPLQLMAAKKRHYPRTNKIDWSQ